MDIHIYEVIREVIREVYEPDSLFANEQTLYNIFGNFFHYNRISFSSIYSFYS